jgi:hypothetical protein
MNKRSSPVPLSHEQSLLVASSYPDLGPAQVEQLRARAGERIDWGLVLDLAAWHGLTPLLARALNRHARELLPEEVLGRLTAREVANTRWSLEAGTELLRLLTQLKQSGVEALPFKGPVQAVQLYGDASLREFSDLDLLIDPADPERAHAVMVRAGYAPEVDIVPAHLCLYMRSECDRVYVHPASGVHVEIHWALAPPYFGVNLPSADVLARAQALEFCGQPVRTVSAEDLLLILCVNGAKEMWEKLEWISAVSVLLNQGNLDWALIDKLSAMLGVRRMVRIGVGLAAGVLGAAVPDAMRTELARDRTAQALVAEAKAWLFAPNFQGLGRGQMTRFRLSARERRRDRIRYRWLRLVTPTHPDLAFLRLAPRFQFLYYALRPIRLAIQYAVRNNPKP